MRFTDNEIEELFNRNGDLSFISDYDRIMDNLEFIRYDAVELHIMQLISDEEIKDLMDIQLQFVDKMKEIRHNKVEEYKNEVRKNGF